MLKAEISLNGKHAYFDFTTDKGYDVIIHALKRIGWQEDIYFVTAQKVNLRFTRKTSGYYQILQDSVLPTDCIFDIFRSAQVIKQGNKEFFSYLDEKIREQEIKNAASIGIYNQLFNAIISKREHPTIIPDPNKLNYEPIRIFNKLSLYIGCRIDRTKLPKGVFCYEVMHDDEQKGIMTLIGECIHVNFWGSILTTRKISLEQGYRVIDEEKDVRFSNDPAVMLEDYMKRYPPQNQSKGR